MTSPTIRVPESQPADAADVTLALEVASAVWEKGDGPDCIKWLMRAVEAAEDAGHSGRAETFMRAIADIGRAMETPGQSGAGAPAESVAPAPPANKTPPPPPLPTASTAPRSRTQPPPLPSAASRAPTPPPPPATVTAPVAAATAAPTATASNTPSRRPPPPPSPSKAPPAPTPSKAPPAPSRAPAPSPPQVARQAEVSARVDAPAASPKTSESRIRVYIRRSNLDPSLYVVRPLTEGSSLPAGAREGSLAIFGADLDESDETAAQ